MLNPDAVINEEVNMFNGKDIEEEEQMDTDVFIKKEDAMEE
jgi:hypothetical protein